MGWIDVIYCESRGDIIIQGGVSLYKGRGVGGVLVWGG